MSSSYHVIIPPQLAEAYRQLSPEDRRSLESRLDTLSQAAQNAFHSPPVLPHWLEVTDISPGKHRVFVGGQWMAYELSDEEHTLQLLDFGSWSSSPLPPHVDTAAWHSSGQREDGWDNEGGGNPPSSS
jgi:mRNA-degrading endonuclease RelE of RelBE toxin-antitoxin system